MTRSTLTTKGQTTIPIEIRRHLGLTTGNQIDFLIRENGDVVLKPALVDVRDLAGILRGKSQKSVSIEDMERTIRKRGAKK